MRSAVVMVFVALLGACSSTHAPDDATLDAGIDAPPDADLLTDEDREILAFFEAECEAWALCPTGIPDAEPRYAHGPEVCMHEFARHIDYLRAALRRGALQVDERERERCMAAFASGRCANVGGAPFDDCGNWLVYRGGAAGLGDRCDYRGPFDCGGGTYCEGSDECRRCVPFPEPGEACDDFRIVCRPPARCVSFTCELVSTIEVGEGDECGRRVSIEGLCAPGLFCRRGDGAVARSFCVRVPVLGEPCPDGLCEAGSHCAPIEGGENVCSAPRGLGELCFGDVSTDPCDHRNGLVCSEGRCVVAGHAEDEPCIASCDEGLFCYEVDQRCFPRETPRPVDLPDGAECWSWVECRSGWCDSRSEPHVCRAADTPCE